MGQRETDIIKEARETLNDGNEHRWATSRLMKLLCNAQQEFCRQIPLITSKCNIQTQSGVEEYHLPEGAIKVLTAKAGGHSIDTISMEELEANNITWEDNIGSTYRNLVVNNLTQQTIRPYPLLSADADPSESVIKIRYSARPELLLWDTTTEDIKNPLSISDMWDYALTQYVISKAFIDYGDESSLSRAQVAQGLYTTVMTDAQRKSKKSFSKRVVTTPYQGKVAKFNNNGVRYGCTNR